MSEDLDKSKIAKNTGLLYIRLLLTVIVGLYTSRVILDKLGVNDYGIYNVVGGVVTVLSFLNSAMVAATQRYLSYELGRGDIEKLKRVFNISFLIHLIIAGIILFLSETIGLWVVNVYLNIPLDRIIAANWVYQFSIIIFIMSVITVPFNACVISHENMNMFAYTSIVETILRLLICFLIGVIPVDPLIMYGCLMAFVSMVIATTYIIYCRRKFKESHFKLVYDTTLFREMFAFAGWNLFGNLGSSFKDQIINIILNVFCGTSINAARGIALQVNTIVNSLASNVAMAINPQITKQYAAGNIIQSKNLSYACARYSFYLLSLIAIPFFLNINSLLGLWLVDIPEYTAEYLIIAISVSLIYSLTGPISTAIQATGRVRDFQVCVCVIMLLEVPLTYVLLMIGTSPVLAVLPTLATNTIALILRFYLLHKYVPDYIWKEYIMNVLFKALLVFVLSLICCTMISHYLPRNILGTSLSIILSMMFILIFIYYLGISRNEKEFIIRSVQSLVSKSFFNKSF